MTCNWKKRVKDSLKNFKYQKASVECMKKLLMAGDNPELEKKIREISANVESMNLALSCLSSEQYILLNEFYISREYGYIDRLCERFNCGKSTIYRLKGEALRAFALFMYGTVE